MASGHDLFELVAKNSQAPATDSATLGTIIDGSVPVIVFPILKFAAGANSHRDWILRIPSSYSGNGFVFSWIGGTDNTSVGVFELEFRMVKIGESAPITNDSEIDLATPVTITDTPPATPINKMNHSTTGNLSHVNASSPDINDLIVIRATRDVSVGSNNTGNLQLVSITVSEQ